MDKETNNLVRYKDEYFMSYEDVYLTATVDNYDDYLFKYPSNLTTLGLFNDTVSITPIKPTDNIILTHNVIDNCSEWEEFKEEETKSFIPNIYLRNHNLIIASSMWNYDGINKDAEEPFPFKIGDKVIASDDITKICTITLIFESAKLVQVDRTIWHNISCLTLVNDNPIAIIEENEYKPDSFKSDIMNITRDMFK